MDVQLFWPRECHGDWTSDPLYTALEGVLGGGGEHQGEGIRSSRSWTRHPLLPFSLLLFNFLLQLLDDQRARTTTTVADGGAAVVARLFEGVDERDDDSRARGTDGVAGGRKVCARREMTG